MHTGALKLNENSGLKESVSRNLRVKIDKEVYGWCDTLHGIRSTCRGQIKYVDGDWERHYGNFKSIYAKNTRCLLCRECKVISRRIFPKSMDWAYNRRKWDGYGEPEPKDNAVKFTYDEVSVFTRAANRFHSMEIECIRGIQNCKEHKKIYDPLPTLYATACWGGGSCNSFNGPGNGYDLDVAKPDIVRNKESKIVTQIYDPYEYAKRGALWKDGKRLGWGENGCVFGGTECVLQDHPVVYNFGECAKCKEGYTDSSHHRECRKSIENIKSPGCDCVSGKIKNTDVACTCFKCGQDLKCKDCSVCGGKTFNCGPDLRMSRYWGNGCYFELGTMETNKKMSCTFEKGVDFSDHGDRVPAHSKEECCRQCNLDARCKAAVYSGDGNCWRKFSTQEKVLRNTDIVACIVDDFIRHSKYRDVTNPDPYAYVTPGKPFCDNLACIPHSKK